MIDLQFDHVHKRYRIKQEIAGGEGAGKLARLKGKLGSLRRRSQDFWAVRDVSFDVQRGEALGIIGHNGAGKSTILKLLSNITTPTSGSITINGRLAALIEVGSGFHPELTGRENIYLNGAILGMSRREITAKLDNIVEFAGLRQFLDVPVKRYSSGMYVRLGFSIAAHLEPDILLLDEVLAVGDSAFQQKCLQRIHELKRAQTTIVFISHDLGAVENLCDRVLLMRGGQLVASGVPRDVIAEYRRAAVEGAHTAPAFAKVSGEAQINSVVFTDAAGNEMTNFATGFRTGEPLRIRLGYTVREPVTDAVFDVFFYSQEDELQCQFTSEFGNENVALVTGTGAIEFSCDEFPLQPGLYRVDATIKRRGAAGGDDVDWRLGYEQIRIDPGKAVRGNFYTPHRWRLVTEECVRLGANQEQVFDEYVSKV